MKYKHKFPEVLLQLMDENKTNAHKLAATLKISPTVVYYWMDGYTSPSTNSLIKLSEVFNVSIDFLLYGDQSQTEQEHKRVEFAKKRTCYETIENCKKAIKSYYQDYLNKLPSDADIDFIDMAILTPNKEISVLLDGIKS